MSTISFIAIYFVLWWLVLFAVLPFGVKSAHESGAIFEEGHDAGAPLQAQMFRKALVTTLISGLLFLGLWWLVTSGVIGLDDIPFLRNAPKLN